MPRKTSTAATREIAILKPFSPGATLSEMLKLSEGKRLISNKEADEILQNPELQKKYYDLFPCRTGTMAIYAPAGKPFGERLSFRGLSFRGLTFEVPKQFRGMVDKMLVIEHPHWKGEETEGGMRIIATEDKIDAIDIRQRDGWYIPEEKHGVPNGESSDKDDLKARYFSRRDSEYIGPLVRWYYDDVLSIRRGVYAFVRPHWRFGVGVVAEQKSEPSSK